MARYLLEIITPEKAFFQEEVDVAILPSFDGEFGIMAGHEKMVDALVSGIIRIRTGEQWRYAASSEGYAMVYGDRVTVMLQSVEWPEEIDESRARKALARAEERLSGDGLSLKDRVLSTAAKHRALARIKLVEEVRERAGGATGASGGQPS